MTFTHLHRYAQPKKSLEVPSVEVFSDHEVLARGARYDLRRGEKVGRFAGFAPTRDGRSFRWVDGRLVVAHPDGRAVTVHCDHVMGPPLFAVVGRWLVCSVDGREPMVIVDTDTGERLGSLDVQRPIETAGYRLFTPTIARSDDGRTLWLGETTRVAQYDIASRALVRAVDAPAGEALVSPAVLPSGRVAAIVRSAAMHAACDRSGDRVAIFDADGREAHRIEMGPMNLATVGDWIVAVDDAHKRLVCLDEHGVERHTIAMFEPAKRAFATVLPLPSGREWVTRGDHGEWDHYGDEALRPPVPSP